MSDYGFEAVDRLPFSTPEKSQRYRTENYRGAVGLNWYETDPTLQLTMAYYLQPNELAVAEPHLRRIGALMGGPVARWAEQTDRNPPRLERYDRWGHDISQVHPAHVVHRLQSGGAGRAEGIERRCPECGHQPDAAAVRGQLSA